MLRAVLCDAHGISLRVIPTKYPSGGAKQLTQILTGKQVPHGGRSSDIGVLMQNVGTAYAVKRAVIDGEPLTERVVTLTGEAVTRPGNVWARLGTPVRHLLNDAGFCPSAEPMVIMGGPLMGFTLPWLDVPVVKITNCLLAPSASEMGEPQEEKGCIRCSACADACPAAVSYTHLRAHETRHDLVCRLLLEKKKTDSYLECRLLLEKISMEKCVSNEADKDTDKTGHDVASALPL